MSTREQRIRKAFDPAKLIEICHGDKQNFDDFGVRYNLMKHDGTKEGDDRFFFYKDNGSKILAVAHLDTVCQDLRASVCTTHRGPIVFSGALDDRLGVYVLCDLLPQLLNVEFDWLLTTDEEKGKSTAKSFTKAIFPEGKVYNWMISFDRGGTDVVMYDYETTQLKKAVEETGVRVGRGSISDISYLTQLGIAGFNWGVGYQDYHSANGHAWLDNTFAMVHSFMTFYHTHKNTLLEYAPKKSNVKIYHRQQSWKDKDNEWHWGSSPGKYNSSKYNSRDPGNFDNPFGQQGHGKKKSYDQRSQKWWWDHDDSVRCETLCEGHFSIVRRQQFYCMGLPRVVRKKVENPQKLAKDDFQVHATRTITAEDVVAAIEMDVCPNCITPLSEGFCGECRCQPLDYAITRDLKEHEKPAQTSLIVVPNNEGEPDVAVVNTTL